MLCREEMDEVAEEERIEEDCELILSRETEAPDGVVAVSDDCRGEAAGRGGAVIFAL